MSDCGHTFKLFGLKGEREEDAIILRRVSVCGIEGFALHYAGHGDFRVSHIETGATCSYERCKDEHEAIRSAGERLSISAANNRTTIPEELARCIQWAKRKHADYLAKAK